MLHMSICASLCNDASLTYNGKTRAYEKIGESTEVALRVLTEKIGLPGFDAMPSALTRLSKGAWARCEPQTAAPWKQRVY